MNKPSQNKNETAEQEFYSKIFSGDEKDSKETELSYFMRRVNTFKKYKGKKVLDAGCGRGILGGILKDEYAIDMYGIDINEVGVKQARKIKIKAKQADLEKKWPYKDNFFDCVVSVQVIEHLVNTDAFITQANRVLKKNGILIISTPNLASWFNRIIFLFGFQPFTLEVSTIDKTLGLKFTRKLTPNREPLGHVRGFTLFALKDLLELHKFEVVKTLGGKVNYLPSYMKGVDKVMAHAPSLAADLIVIAKKK